MYIPDKIKILGRGLNVKIWSDDEGHGHEGPLQIISVTVTWGELRPVAATVEYGTQIQTVGEPMPPAVRVDYDAAHIAVDWMCYPERIYPERITIEASERRG